jgi:DNA polymerase alpha subunit B
MVVAGPFTTQDGLLYEPLKDLMDLVKRDQPHCLILMGPFLDARNEDLMAGDICIETYSDKGSEYEFFDYEDLTKLLMKYIQSEIHMAQK